MKNLILSVGFYSITAILVSCSSNDADVTPTADLVTNKQILTDVSLNVITETYKNLNEKALILVTAANELSIGNEVELTAVKNAWIAARSPWEKSEGFLYGPVDTEGIDPAIDSWPVDVTAINNILNSTQAITSSLLESNNEARGFHTLEFFVWGLNGNKTATQLTSRELDYLKAAAQNLQSKTLQLYNAWLSSQGNFVNNFINAGQAGSNYTSQKDALLEFVEGIILISDEVANGKIEEPLNGNNGSAKPEAEESRFSNNSKLDFADNMRSIQNIYLGNYNSFDGKGISEIVSQKNNVLDLEIQAKIVAAIQAIEAIPGTFTNAIVSNRTAVQNAQTKVADLKAVLETKLQPLFSNL
jgi:putative iron-regulated protein